MRVLVTGVHGFVGGSVARFAVRQGHEVLGLARSSQPPDDWRAGYSNIDVAWADAAPVLEEFRPDLIVHCAGSASVHDSFQDPAADFNASTGILSRMLDSVRRSSSRPLVIFPSSAAVYGNSVEFPIAESAAVAPISPYGFNKLAAEVIAQGYARCFGLKVCICRLFSVFGPAQRRLLVWELFEEFSGSNPVVGLKGTGEESRDYLHIDDVASAFLGLAAALVQYDAPSEPWVFNVASGMETPVMNLASLIGSIGGWAKPVKSSGKIRSGDPQKWRADIARLREVLPNWKPSGMESRLAETLNEWRR